MKLLLYSRDLTEKHVRKLAELVGKSINDITLGVIENAADNDVKGPKDWVAKIRASLQQKGFTTRQIDLGNLSPDELKAELAEIDAIWVCGGSAAYLRALMERTGADAVIQEAVKNGLVYSGWSAGGIIPASDMPNLKMIEDTESLESWPDKGLGFVDFTIVPHLDNPDIADAQNAWAETLESRGISTVRLNDDQAVVVIDGSYEVI